MLKLIGVIIFIYAVVVLVIIFSLSPSVGHINQLRGQAYGPYATVDVPLMDDFILDDKRRIDENDDDDDSPLNHNLESLLLEGLPPPKKKKKSKSS